MPTSTNTMLATKTLLSFPQTGASAYQTGHPQRGHSDQQHDDASINVSIAAAHAARHARRHSEHVGGRHHAPRRPTARDDSYFPYFEWTDAASAGTSTLPTAIEHTHTRSARRGRSPNVHHRAALSHHSNPSVSYATSSPRLSRRSDLVDEELRRDSLESVESTQPPSIRSARTRQDSERSYFSDDSDGSSESDCESIHDMVEAEVRHVHKTSAVQVSHAIVVDDVDGAKSSLDLHFASCPPPPPPPHAPSASQSPVGLLYHTTPSPSTPGSCATPSTMDEVIEHVARVMRSNSRRGRLQAVHLNGGTPPTLRRRASNEVA